MREVDSKQAIFRVQTMEEILSKKFSWRRFYTLMLAVFAAVQMYGQHTQRKERESAAGVRRPTVGRF